MELPIEICLFEDYPIEFKEINPEDFKYFISGDGERIERTESTFIIENNEEKILISPNDLGYINQSIQDNIVLDHKNTVVINAAVGQGKSYAIIQTLKRYYDADQEYLIFVASPFVSLVKQYCDDIEEAGIPSEHIYSYENIGRTGIQYINKPIQVITVNTLLGNPGEDGFKNSDEKREYLNNLSRHCEENDIKVVFIYDEIHDSYQNFKQEYIFNLWKWSNVIIKNYILSATFNEASKVVIEYLAELTDFKIQIIESARSRFSDKQSDLHLHFASSFNFTTNTLEINELIKELILNDKSIDILCYSKALAKSISNPKEELGNLLHKTFGELKDCTSELSSNQREENEPPKNQYDNTKCNVGTNFKTGVSIKKENHALVIILPPRSTKMPFKNMFGIFSGGINSVIQALARQRNKGEIHVVLPRPDKFNFSSLNQTLMNETQKIEFKNYYGTVQHYKQPDELVNYIKLNTQDSLLRDFYINTLKANISNQEIEVNSLPRIGLPILIYPSYEEFRLENGEDYLANKYPIFGEDISSYITYAALTNQFVNCKLKTINVKPYILFKEGEMQSNLLLTYETYFGIEHLYTLGNYSNFNLFYSEIRNTLFNEYELRYQKSGDTKSEKIKPGTSMAKYFEIQLLIFIHNLKNYSLDEIALTEDFCRKDYFLDCIANSVNLAIDDIIDENYKNRVKFYKLFNGFRDKLINSLHEHHRGSAHFYCIPSSLYETFFDEEDKSNFRELLSLLEYDKLLNDKVFEFKRRFDDRNNFEDKLKTLYSIMVEDFLVVEPMEIAPRIFFEDKRRSMKIISAINLLPIEKNTINYIAPFNYTDLEL